MELWEVVCSVLVPAVGIIAALWKGWAKAKRWARLGAIVSTKTGEFLVAVADAIEDDDLSRDELKEIGRRFWDIIDPFRGE